MALAVLVVSAISVVLFLGQPGNNDNNQQNQTSSVIGFPVDAGLWNGKDVMFIHDSAEKVSIRFTAKLSGTMLKLAIYAFAYEGQPTVYVGLQGDSGGNPDGVWINGNAFSIIQLPDYAGFITVQLVGSIFITKGQVYHIVIEAAESPLNGTAGVFTYYFNGFGQPFNPSDPDILWNDTRMSVLKYNGQAWQEQDKWPIFVVVYADGSLEGQPYSLAAPWVVWGSTYVGQTFIPTHDYKITKIAFDVSLKSGTPVDNLYYQIRDSGNKVLAEGIFAQPGQLTTTQTWIEVVLPTALTIKAGQLYRILVMSQGSGFENAYRLYGHEYSYNDTIGYGGLQHRITSSLNGGENWADNYDADAIFKLTTA